MSQAYRKAIDDMYLGKDFDNDLLVDLDKVANRGYSTGFMVREKPGSEAQNYNTSISRNFSQRFAGLLNIDAEVPEGYIAVDVKNKIFRGQECEIISPACEKYSFEVKEILDKNKSLVESAHGGAGIFYFKSDFSSRIPYGVLSLKLSSEELREQS
ncbi:MAG: U32 family peptidase C-terminal domain-containing protein [Bdellovibrionaceae bacterium]|nr:U32 family peptidase C-terminal domain-containing protein [Pseudobdellovibrionaceae bacterium]